MGVSYDLFTNAFLSKITEHDFVKLEQKDRVAIIDEYMKRACAQFSKICKYDITTRHEDRREFAADIPEADLEIIVDIVTDGMLVEWMKPYVYKQENLESVLNTADYTSYSPAELLHRITSAYKMSSDDFSKKMLNYSYSYGDIGSLYL